MMTMQIPGENLTRWNRFSRMLESQNPQQMNDGTIFGGLASTLTRGLQGFAQGRDDQMRGEADQLLSDAMAQGGPEQALAFINENGAGNEILTPMARNLQASIWQQNSQPVQVYDPVQNAMVYTTRGEMGPNALASAPQMPEVRERFDGNQIIYEQLDPQTGQMVTVGSAPRWQPQRVAPESFGQPYQNAAGQWVVQGSRGTVRPANEMAIPMQEQGGIRYSDMPDGELALHLAANPNDIAAQTELVARQSGMVPQVNLTPTGGMAPDISGAAGGDPLSMDALPIVGAPSAPRGFEATVTAPPVADAGGASGEIDYSQFTADQLKSAGFADRMAYSRDILDSFEANAGTADPFINTGQSMIGGVPFVGDRLQRGTLSDEQAQYLNAATNWIRANMRLESGAVIGPDEMRDEYELYFPMPGDSPEVIAQKRRLRERTERAVQTRAGPAWGLYQADTTTGAPSASAPGASTAPSDDDLLRMYGG